MTESTTRFPGSLKDLFAGASRVNRDEFAKQFDLGVPLDPSSQRNSEVLILYSDDRSIPPVRPKIRDAISSNEEMPLLGSVDKATKNCNTLKIILTETRRRKHCLAIMGQWESYHIHKYMRLPPDEIRTGIDSNLPLRHVARTHSDRKGKTQIIPKEYHVKHYETDILSKYLSSLPDVLERLKPIAGAVAKKHNNTVIVLVCNLGQVELLTNFICNCRSKGFDTSALVVFCTDLETLAIAKGLGVATFYDEQNFESMPAEAARRYGDGRFIGMMLAKVFVVHWTTQLKHNVLFQDVDVVWERNPLEFFLRPKESNPYYDFDMYFQDDGAHTIRYAPFSPNTGFYFVRANERTQYFFSCLVRLGDMIVQTGSHQASLTSLLNEHSSYRGLLIKVFSRFTDEFPGGFHYHRDKGYMQKFFAGKVHPYIFHMSWTKNKDNKRLFFEQMGSWYVTDQCTDKTSQDIVGHNVISSTSIAPESLVQKCCLPEPLFRCHYRDKPSLKPCKDSPPIDDGKKSWW